MSNESYIILSIDAWAFPVTLAIILLVEGGIKLYNKCKTT